MHQIPILNVQKELLMSASAATNLPYFLPLLDKYTQMDHFFIPKDKPWATFNDILKN